MTRKCVSHTHEWATLYTSRIERCRKHHFERPITDILANGRWGPRHGSVEITDKCQQCGGER